MAEPSDSASVAETAFELFGGHSFDADNLSVGDAVFLKLPNLVLFQQLLGEMFSTIWTLQEPWILVLKPWSQNL